MLKKLVIGWCSLFVLAPVWATEYFVSRDGNGDGDGSQSSPWSLSKALLASSTVKPGDTIWLRGGTYPGIFTCNLRGSESAPIVIRNFEDERVVIDGSLAGKLPRFVTVLTMQAGGYVWFWGLEIANSDPKRTITAWGSNPAEGRGPSIDINAPGVKLINLVIHDTGQGIGAWGPASDFEAHGNVIFNNGWMGPDRGHGHAIYTQNNSGEKLFSNNVILHQFGDDLSMYGSPAAFLRNITFDGNVFVNGRVLLGGNTPSENIVFRNNYTYNTSPEFGYGVPSRGLICDNNYLSRGISISQYLGDVSITRNTVFQQINDGQAKVLGIQLLPGTSIRDFTIDFNTYYQSSPQRYDFWLPGSLFTFPTWQEAGMDPHGVYIRTDDTGLRPTGLKVGIANNKYDPRKTTLAIYNWDRLDSVPVDVSSVLSPGDRYELRSAQDYFGDIETGTYDGGPLSIRMANRTLALPLGYEEPVGDNTFPEFGAFVLTKTGAAPVSNADAVKAWRSRIPASR